MTGRRQTLPWWMTVLWIRNDFFGSISGSGFFNWFRIRPEFLLIFLTWILPLYSRLVSVCNRLHIMMRYKLFRDFFVSKRNLYFNMSIFVEKLSNFITVVLLKNPFRVRSCSDPDPERYRSWSGMTRIQILLKVSDPTTTLVDGGRGKDDRK